MAYTKQTWACGDEITAEKLNNIEDGIEEALECCGSGGENYESVTHAELLAMRNNGTLTPGMQYRITDYICTTTQEDTRVVSNPFDIIVVADDENTLNENARACLHEGDTYYSSASHSAVLESWELKYCIDNDTDRFGWADATNGKGVVYWLKDERNNECPYDFKQIQFSREESGTSNWYYTFSVRDGGAETVTSEDASVSLQDGTGCVNYGNVIRPLVGDGYDHGEKGVLYLNDIVFSNTFGNYCNSNTFGDDCYGNTFGNNCYSNTFGDDCNSNTFGDGCYGNTFGNNCNSNTFGDDCYSNTFVNNCNRNTFGDDCNSNTFGDGCYRNTFGNDCYSNTFGNGCYRNTFGNDCYGNTFGNNCYSNTFGDGCNSNTFGDGCYSNTFGDYCNSNTFGDGCNSNTFGNNCNINTFGNNCQYVDFFLNASTTNNRYYHIMSGTAGTSSSHLAITGTNNNTYVTYVGKNSSGTLKTWVPADQA